MTVLAATAGLTHKLAFRFDTLANGFAVSNLRFAHAAVDFELAQHAVNDDFQVQLAHAGNNGLACFRVGVGPESRIFFRQTR